MHDMNVILLQYLNSFTQYEIVQDFVFLFADLPIFFLPIFLVVLWCYYSWKEKSIEEKKTLMYIFYACVIAILISLLIQQFIHLERPETALINSGKLLLDHIPDASFPSDHASVSVAFLVALFLFGYKKVFWYFLPFAIIMNISRVVGGVHWPFDVGA